MSGMAMADSDKAQEAEEKMKPILAVLEKHGLDEQTLEQMQEETWKTIGGNRQEATKKLVSPIKDRGKFVADMINTMKEIGQPGKCDPLSIGCSLGRPKDR